MKQNKTIVNDINKMFPAANKKHPICFIRDGETNIIVSGECYAKIEFEGINLDGPIIDYYGEFRGGYAWIDTKLEKYAEELGMHWEWENPACICLYS